MPKNRKETSQEIVEQLEGEPIDMLTQEGNSTTATDNQNAQPPEGGQGIDVSEDDIVALLEQGLTEQELSAKSPEEIKELIQKAKGQQSTPPSPSVITEDIANQVGGIAKSFVGKPISDVLKALAEQDKYIGQISKELREIKIALAQQQIQPKAVTDDEKTNAAKFTQNQSMSELEKLVEQAIAKRLPQIEKLTEASIEQKQKEILSAIQNKLGNNYKAEDIVVEFGREMELGETDIAYYENNPSKFVRDVVDYVKRKELEKELTEIKKQKSYAQKLEVAKKIRQILATQGKQQPQGQALGTQTSDEPDLATVRAILND